MGKFTKIDVTGVMAGKIRDLNYFCLDDGTLLVFACDSDGGVGGLPRDESYRAADIAGKIYSKCVFMELLACGAEPVIVYNDFCYEPSDYNYEVCESIKEQAASLGLDSCAIKNTFGTYANPLSTAYGVTAVGVVRKGELRIGKSRPGDFVCAIGIPSEKMSFDKHVMPSEVKLLREQDFVHEILPCGSHGIRKEAADLAAVSCLEFKERSDHELSSEGDLSCGASAVVLVTLQPDCFENLLMLGIEKTITVIGELRGESHNIDFDAVGSNSGWTITEDYALVFENGWELSSLVKFSYAIGALELDVFSNPSHGEIACGLADSAIKELKESGKEPLLVVNDLNFSMKRGGLKTIVGLEELLKRLHMDPKIQLTGSTEDNHIAVQSGYAVRVFGICRK